MFGQRWAKQSTVWDNAESKLSVFRESTESSCTSLCWDNQNSGFYSATLKLSTVQDSAKSSWTLSAELSCCSFMLFSFLMNFKKSTCDTLCAMASSVFLLLKKRWGLTEVKNWHSSRSRTALIRQILYCLYIYALFEKLFLPAGGVKMFHIYYWHVCDR